MAASVSAPSVPLKDAVCLPCVSQGGKLTLLPHEEVVRSMAELCPTWQLVDDGKVLERKFNTTNFQTALDAVVAFGALAERLGHHPDLSITGYRTVTIRLFTHALGGVSINDLIVAAHSDQVPIKYSPKWLLEHSNVRAGVSPAASAIAT